MLTFGELLRQHRQGLDLTQEALAERVGCAVETVRKIERNARRPSHAMAGRLAVVLGIEESQRPAFLRLARAGAGRTQPQQPGGPGVLDLPEFARARTPLVGRDSELEALLGVLSGRGTRLVTITGPGGVGKTRLASAAAAAMADRLPAGVFMVSLSAVRDSQLAWPPLAAALGISEVGEVPLERRVNEYLREREVLLVLDNLEQLPDAGRLITTLLTSAPGTKVLATSRERLHLYDEQEFPLGPLQVPTAENLADGQSREGWGAVALFVERARLARPDFKADRPTRQTVAAICRRLDGLPLAIELAAAQLRYFPPEALLARLSRRLELLIGGPRDLPARQQTLRSTMDWSYELLSSDGQRLFTQAAVFGGAFTAEAAEAICDAQGTATGPMEAALLSLVDKSLLQVSLGESNELRFSMLETVKEYAQELLRTSGEEGTRTRYADYFMQLAEGAEPGLLGAHRSTWYHRIEAELPNFRSLLQWSMDTGCLEIARRVAAALGTFWLIGGHLSEGRQWLDAGLEADQACEPLLAVKLLAGLEGIAVRQGDYAAVSRYVDRHIAICRENRDAKGTAECVRLLGDVALEKGAYDEARSLYIETLGMCRSAGDDAGMAHVLNNMGELARCEGAYADAEQHYLESVRLYRELGDASSTARGLINLGWAVLYRGSPDQAAPFFTESLRIHRCLEGSPHRIAACVMGLAAVAAKRSEPEQAATLFAAATTALANIGASMDGPDRLEYDHYLDLARTRMSKEQFEYAWQRGKTVELASLASKLLD